MNYYLRSAKSSSTQIENFIYSLDASFREANEFLKTVKEDIGDRVPRDRYVLNTVRQERDVFERRKDRYINEVDRIEYRMNEQFKFLSGLAEKFGSSMHEPWIKR